MNTVNPHEELKKELLKVNMPGRYVGGEYGSIIKAEAGYRVALCFPDLYEIGMSNQAVKILYDIVNTETEAACERVFNPAPDFEEVLRKNELPLFSLETGACIKDFDLLAFTIGYELSATNILNVLELSGIPLRNSERDSSDPIVIAGGPAATNPVPFGEFLDAVYIGEAEDVFADTVKELAARKKAGADRTKLIELIRESEFFWYAGRDKPAKKAVWNGFGRYKSKRSLLIPSLKTVQDHGVVEIMRGCPNGCRFCHAGIFYRPFREKNIDVILREVEDLVDGCGYREVTLSSLSSGDYSRISDLIRILNNKYSDRKISFSFPSMRVNSFTLPLISEISKVRKSGLTFAVETPELVNQRGLNKEVPVERIINILEEARRMGWKKAKFYFMVGLPFFKEQAESDAIIDFLRKVGRETRMQLNVNIGTFIPKPHTPFQWSFQLGEQEAFDRIIKIKKALPDRFFKVGFQSPFISFIEGMISRGDERAGELILRAFKKGARLDAWEEYMRKDVWREVFNEAGWDVEETVCSGHDTEEALPWNGINLSVGSGFLKDEYSKALKGELTDSCSTECGHKCGACTQSDKVKISAADEPESDVHTMRKEDEQKKTRDVKILFSFSKKKQAIYLSHINVMSVFERAFIRAGIDIISSEGFNPKPRLEFANPITLGFESEDEIASVEIRADDEMSDDIVSGDFVESLNSSLPAGFEVIKAKVIKKIASEETGKKVKSLMASYNGGSYRLDFSEGDGTAKLIERVSESLEDEDGVKIITDSEALSIVIDTTRSSGGKTLNIFRFFKERLEIEHPFDFVSVKRNATYCALEEADSVKKFSYFECYT